MILTLLMLQQIAISNRHLTKYEVCLELKLIFDVTSPHINWVDVVPFKKLRYIMAKTWFGYMELK